MRYAILFLLLGTAQIYLAFQYGGIGGLFAWSGLSFLVAGTAYAGLGPRVFGKRADGTMGTAHVVLLLPYLLVLWGLWHLQRIMTREPACNELLPGLWIGRRPFPHELPPEVRLVVDLTSEFIEPKGVRTGRDYLCLPILDTLVPDERALQEAVDAILASPHGVYIHCALGHGRTGMAAIALLRVKGEAARVDEALQRIQSVRPQVDISPDQRAFLQRLGKGN